MKRVFKIFLEILIGIYIAGCNSNKTNSANSDHQSTQSQDGTGSAAIQDEESKPTVLKIAMNSEQHKTLVKAVQAAGLVDVLAAVGPYTVFAPTDEAFAKLPQDALNDLLKPENQSKLQDILQFHVTTSVYSKDAFTDGMKLPMANGKSVTIALKDGQVFINNAKIIAGPVEGSNGNVYVIDEVLK